MTTKDFAVALISILLGSAFAFAQQKEDLLINRMRQHENSILQSYLEYQKLYYEDKSRKLELQAFEKLLTVYIEQVMEIYETLSLSQQKTEIPRDIAARALIFKSLMYLEKAPLNYEYYEKACYEYFEALNLYEGTDDPPAIFKDLPQSIEAGNQTYYRLIDLLEDKGQGLAQFGKVIISFRNFRVTANFDPLLIELVKIEDTAGEAANYTYLLSEARIRDAFNEVFQRTREIETYVALPKGTYVLRLRSVTNPIYTPLTRFSVRPNQEQNNIMEPLADWLVLYENPRSRRPDFYKFRRNNQTANSMSFASNAETEAKGKSSNGTASSNGGMTGIHEELVAEIVSHYLPKFEIKLMFDLNDPEIKDNATQIIAKSVVSYTESRAFYNEWNVWTASWEIAREVREVISPGSVIPVELLKLIYTVMREL